MSVVVIDSIRTPRGAAKPTGSLAGVEPVRLLAGLHDALVRRTGLDTATVCESLIGCVSQTGEQGGNIAKTALLLAGWDAGVGGGTINRYCTSGLTAVNLAAGTALAQRSVALAGGVEMMSRVPMFADKAPLYSDPAISEATRFFPMPLTSDLVATQHGITRAHCDEYAALSQSRAATARREGRFKSIVPVRADDGTVLLERDETIREGATAAKLGELKTVYEPGAGGLDAKLLALFPQMEEIDHVHTAGNAPCMADGAALVLLAESGRAQELGLRARARIVSHAHASVALTQTGAVDATRRALDLAGLTVGDIDLFEVRDSFAAITLHYVRSLGIDLERFNVNGSSIALGHPMGATGAMLLGTALDELERTDKRLAVVAIAGATGVATATVIERLH